MAATTETCTSPALFLKATDVTRPARDRALGVLQVSKVIRSARSPIAGLLLEANPEVKAQLRLINTDSYGDGWLVRMQPTAESFGEAPP